MMFLLFLLASSLSPQPVVAQTVCSDLTGIYDYSYGSGKGVTTVIQEGDSVIMISTWYDGDEYLTRATRKNNVLEGDSMLFKQNGRTITPVSRNYRATIDRDCSITNRNSQGIKSYKRTN